jgi:hypothetical protein
MSALTEPEKGRVLPGAFFLTDQMRLGKSKQVIDTAQVLFERNEIDSVIVVAPAPVRDVWYDPELGEIQKHRWLGLPTLVTEYHQQIRKWSADAVDGQRYLTWVITNFEYIRYGVVRDKSGWHGNHLDKLLKFANKRTLLVIDESAAVADYAALQTRACLAIRQRCGRVIELNGTPIVETPESLYSQAKMLDPRILGFNYVSQYKATYAIMGGYYVEKKIWQKGKLKTLKIPTEIVGWRHKLRPECCEIPPHIQSKVHEPGPCLEDIQAKLAPYVLRRIRTECLDLPPKLDSVTLTATLTPETWRIYTEMRDDLVSWLDEHTVATSQQAGVRVMRLAQVTSGFLGGLRDDDTICPECGGGDPVLDSECPACGGTGTISAPVPARAIGREKLDLFLTWVKKRLKEEKELRMVAWCRFRPELQRTAEELQHQIKDLKVRAIFGGQPKEDRINGLRLMHPDVKYGGPAVLLGTLGTGGLGVSMAGAHEVVYVSNDRSLYKRLQSEDRPLGPGQTEPVSYHDIVAVGPKGQHTIDHTIMKALRDKTELATWTTDAWKTALMKEDVSG